MTARRRASKLSPSLRGTARSPRSGASVSDQITEQIHRDGRSGGGDFPRRSSCSPRSRAAAPRRPTPSRRPAPQPGVDVVGGGVTLSLDPDALSIRATATLVVDHPPDLGTLRLGLDAALAVSAVRVDRREAAFSRDGDALFVRVQPHGPRSVVEIDYAGTPTEGLYAADAAGQRIVFTDGWPDRTAGWLPTVHYPADPFTLDLMVDVPAALDLVLSGETVSDTVSAGTPGRPVAPLVERAGVHDGVRPRPTS